MKRLLALICCFAVAACSFTLCAFAGQEEFFDDYFTGGVIATPDKGYVSVDNRIGESTKIDISFPISQQIYHFGTAYDRCGYTEFCERYGFEDSSLAFSVQVDYSLNSESDWHYRPVWDTDTSYGSAYIGYTSKVETQRVIDIHNTRSDYYVPLKDAVIVGNNDDGTEYAYLDLENNTLYFRYRYCISFVESGEYEPTNIFSDWSETFSYTGDEPGAAVEAPKELPAPLLSDLSMKKDEDGTSFMFDLEFSQSFYEAELYYEEYGGSTGVLQAQININGDGWEDAEFADGKWKTGGMRTIRAAGETEITEHDTIQLRVRLTEADPLGSSLWSNIISLDGKSDEPAETTVPFEEDEQRADDGEKNTEKSGSECSLCGICPFQPLGICMFVWLAVMLILIILIIIAVKKSKGGKKKKRKKRKSSKKKSKR